MRSHTTLWLLVRVDPACSRAVEANIAAARDLHSAVVLQDTCPISLHTTCDNIPQGHPTPAPTRPGLSPTTANPPPPSINPARPLIAMCGTQISYACSNTLISKSITCSCDRIIACGKSTLNCGTCNHPRCRELRGESVSVERMHYSGTVSTGGK